MLSRDERLAMALSQSKLFMGTQVREVDFRYKTFSSGEKITEMCDDIQCIGIVLDGEVQVISQQDYPIYKSKKHMIEDVCVRDGAIFGICNVFSQQYPASNLIAKKKTEIAYIPYNDFMKILENNPTILKRYLSICNSQITKLSEMNSLLSIPNCKNRLSKFLVLAADNNNFVSLDFSKDRLARYLCVGRASLFRCLSELYEENIIEAKPGGIRILDLKKLSV